jgi:hypothetical protein
MAAKDGRSVWALIDKFLTEWLFEKAISKLRDQRTEPFKSANRSNNRFTRGIGVASEGKSADHQKQ